MDPGALGFSEDDWQILQDQTQEEQNRFIQNSRQGDRIIPNRPKSSLADKKQVKGNRKLKFNTAPVQMDPSNHEGHRSQTLSKMTSAAATATATAGDRAHPNINSLPIPSHTNHTAVAPLESSKREAFCLPAHHPLTGTVP